MAIRCKKMCAVAGCGKLTLERWCDQHAKNPYVARPYDQLRGSSAERGYDNEWRKLRLVALRRDNYLCLECLKDDRPTPAIDVDHIIPISEAPERRLDLDNLQSLCKYHHRLKTQKETNWSGLKSNGSPQKEPRRA